MARQIAAKVCTDGETVMDTKFFVFSASKPYFYTSFWEDHILNELNIPCKNVELKEVVGKRMKDGFTITGSPNTDALEAIDSFGLNMFTFNYSHMCTALLFSFYMFFCMKPFQDFCEYDSLSDLSLKIEIMNNEK